MKRQTRTLLFLVAASLPLAAAQQTTIPSAPPAPTQYSGHSTIEQLNYDRGGAVNGFVMSDGVLVFTPPITGITVIQKGSTVNVQGMSHQTMSGRKVVDAQSLKVGDQTIVFAMDGPRRGPGGPGAPPLAPPPPPAPPR